MATHRFIEALLDRRPLSVYGDGRQARDFTFVSDVVAATSAALTASLPTGSVLNVARGESVEVRDLIAMLAEELGVEPRIQHRPSRPGDTLRTEGCADLARELLGWEPVTDVRSGLRQQVDWHLHRRLRMEEPLPGAAADALSYPAAPASPLGASEQAETVEAVGVSSDGPWRGLQ
jgi:UDP-glucuronate 4-epimerase